MPDRPPAPCTYVPCPVLVRGGGRCPTHKAEARRTSDGKRGTFTQRGYGVGHVKRFRPAVLRRDPYCMCDLTICDHGDRHCWRPSTVADHWPMSKRELLDRGMDSNDPAHGRGLCAPCDHRQTARRQPGGINRRPPGAGDTRQS
jgi:5-methylcytosine-specific restriction enzyme A